MIAARRNLYELKGTTKDGAVYNFGNNIKELDHNKFNYYLGVVDVLIPCNKYHSSNCLTVVPEFYVPNFDISFLTDKKYNTYHLYKHEGQKYNNFESFRNMIKSALIKFSEKHLVVEKRPKVDDFKIKIGDKKYLWISCNEDKGQFINELLENKVTVNNKHFNDIYELFWTNKIDSWYTFICIDECSTNIANFKEFLQVVIGSRAKLTDFKFDEKISKTVSISYNKNNKLQKQVIESMLNEDLLQYFGLVKSEAGSVLLEGRDTLKTDDEILEKIKYYLNNAIKTLEIPLSFDKFKFEMTEDETHISFPVKTVIEYPPESSYFEQIFGIPKYTILEANKEYNFKIHPYSQFNLIIKSNMIDGSIFRWNVEHNKKKSSFITPNNIFYFPLKEKQSILDEIKITFEEIENNLPISVMVDFIAKEKLSDGNGNVYKILL